MLTATGRSEATPVPIRVSRVAAIVGLFVAYVVVARLGLLLALPPEKKATAVWPASGLALAALLALGLRVWPGVWLGALLANLWDYFAVADPAPFTTHLGVSFGIAAGSTLQALAGAALLHRFVPSGRVLDSARRVFLFVGVTLTVCLIAASFGALSLWLSGFAPTPAIGTIWWTWWLGDATGILLIAPLLLAWGLPGRSASERGDWGEAAGVLVFTAGVGLLVFGGSELTTGVSPMAYLTIPLLVWAAVRFGQRGATTGLVVVSGLAVWGTAQGYGPFVRAGLNESLLLLQVFMGVVAMTALVLAASLTERQDAADALRASEEQFRVLTEALPHMVWTMRPDATLEFANARASEFVGRTGRELRERGWADLVHPEDRMVTRSVIAGALNRGEPFEVESRVRHHTGEYRWVVSRAVPLRGDAGEVVKWIGSSHDTHDRRTAEDSLRMSERRYRALIQATPQVVWRIREGETGLSGWWTDLTGQTAEASSGWGWLDAVHPDDRERVRATWARVSEALVPYEHEYRVRVRSGEYRYVAVRGVALCDRSGRLEEWVGTLTDVHDKKSAEEGLRQLNATLEQRVTERTRALEESEQRFRAIFHTQNQFIGLLLPDGTLLEANRTSLVSVGTTEGAVLGRPFWETPWWAHAPGQRDRLRDAVRRAAAGEPVRFEASHPTADGPLMWVDFSLTPFRDPTGRVALLIPESRDVTERRAATAALGASEALLRQFVAHAPAAIAMLDTELRYLRVSDRWRTDYHLSDADIIGRSHYDVFPDIPERWKEIHRRALAGAVEACEEDPFPRADGSLDWLQWEARPWRNAGGDIGGVIFFTQVITARKRVEAELRESRERLEMALAASRMGVWEWDMVSGALYWSPECHEILGHVPFDGTLHSFSDRIHPDDKERGWASIQAAIDGHAEYASEFRFVFPNGEARWMWNVGHATYDASGAPVRMVGLVQDVTARKRTEAALRESEERFRLLVEGITDYAVFMLDTAGRVASWNTGAERINGYTAEEILGRHFSIFYPPEAIATGHPDHELATALATGRYTEDGPRVRKGGSQFWASVAITSLRDHTGRHIGFVKVTRDVTERRATEEHLAASLREKELLLKEIHHRVKNNLQIVSTLLDLQSAHTTDPAALEMFQECCGRVRSMALIHERLYRSHDLARVNFSDYVRQLADDLYHTYRVSDEDVRLAVDVDIPPLPIDTAIPCGLLLNELISNCLKHAFKDRPSGLIRVLLGQSPGDDRTNILMVSDDGRGLPSGLDFRNTPSFGLQLVSTLVDQLGGALAVTADRGTTVTIRFPRPSTDPAIGTRP